MTFLSLNRSTTMTTSTIQESILSYVAVGSALFIGALLSVSAVSLLLQ
jgi:hypothetical protein